MDSKTWEGSRCRHHVDFSKCAKKRPTIHPLARPKTRSFCTFRNLSFDRSTTEEKPLYLTSFTEKKSSQSQGKGHCQLLPKDWKTASHALTGDPVGPTCPAATTGCYGPPLCIRPIVRIFGKWKCEFIANFSATMVTSLPSLSLSVSLYLSLSLSLKVPYAQYRKRFRASCNIYIYIIKVKK